MGRSYDLQEVMSVRPDSRHIMLAQVLKPNGNDIDPVSVGHKFAAGIEQRLLDLVIRREPDVEIQVEVAPPEGDDGF